MANILRDVGRRMSRVLESDAERRRREERKAIEKAAELAKARIRLLKLVDESQAAGARVLAALDAQGEKLDKAEDGMDSVHFKLEDAEADVEQMSKCCGLIKIKVPTNYTAQDMTDLYEGALGVVEPWEVRPKPKLGKKARAKQFFAGKKNKLKGWWKGTKEDDEEEDGDKADAQPSTSKKPPPPPPPKHQPKRRGGPGRWEDIDQVVVTLRSMAKDAQDKMDTQINQVERSNRKAVRLETRIITMDNTAAGILGGEGELDLDYVPGGGMAKMMF